MAGILHILGYGLIEPVDSAKLGRFRAALETLVASVDGAELIGIGDNFSQSRFAVDWDYAAVVRLPDRAALAAYLAHPAHAALGAEASDGFYQRCAIFDIEGAAPNKQGDPS